MNNQTGEATQNSNMGEASHRVELDVLLDMGLLPQTEALYALPRQFPVRIVVVAPHFLALNNEVE